VQLYPKPKFLIDYKNIEIPVIESEIIDEEILAELMKIRERNQVAKMIEDKNIELKNNDIAVIDFIGTINGKEFKDNKANNYELKIGSNYFVPTFESQLIGMKINEEKTINVKFPKLHKIKELADKIAEFKVKLNAIKNIEYPEIDDEFAKDVSEFETLEELKEDIKEKLQEKKEIDKDLEIKNKIIKHIVANTEIDLPITMVEKETDMLVSEFIYRLDKNNISFDAFLENAGKTKEDIKNELKEKAIEKLKIEIITDELFKLEGIDVLKEDLDKRIKEYIIKNNLEDSDIHDVKIKPEYLDAVKKEIKLSKLFNVLLRKE
jgi:trigger factor